MLNGVSRVLSTCSKLALVLALLVLHGQSSGSGQLLNSSFIEGSNTSLIFSTDDVWRTNASTLNSSTDHSSTPPTTVLSYTILSNARANRSNMSSVLDLSWYSRTTRFPLTAATSPSSSVAPNARSYTMNAPGSMRFRPNEIRLGSEMITTPVTATTTSTTTTTTSVVRPVTLVKSFKILAVSLNVSTYAIQIDYQVEMHSISSYLVLKVEFDCSSKDSNQTWYQSVSNQLFTKPLTLSTVSLFSQTRPVHGSLVTCVGYLSDTSKGSSSLTNDTITHSANLLIDPLPVTNLMFNNINSTCIRLSWFYPQNSFYDSVHIQCAQNDKMYHGLGSQMRGSSSVIFDKYIENKMSWRLNKNINLGQQLLVDLTPGVYYSCSIATIRNTSSLFAQASSKTVTIMTDLNMAILKNSAITITNASLFSLEVTPPSGFYDYFQIQLVLSSNGMVIINKNFSYDPTMLTLPIVFHDTNQKLIHSGVSYEFWTQTVRKSPAGQALLSFSKRVKLGEAFMIKPEPVSSLFFYVLSNTQVGAYWTAPTTGFYEHFKVSLLSNNQALVFASMITANSSVLDVDLVAVERYLLSVQACSKLNNSPTELCSDPVNMTISTRYPLVYSLRVDRTESLASVNIKNNNLAVLSLRLNNTGSNLCDLSQFHVRYFDMSSLSKYDCFTALLDTTVFNTNQSSIVCQNTGADTKSRPNSICKTISPLNCTQGGGDDDKDDFTCTFQISQLKPNTRFNITIAAVSQNGLYEWPSTASVLLKTDVSLPLINSRVETNSWLQSQIASPKTINIIEPYIDQSRGSVLEGYLYLVRLGTVKDELVVSSRNRSDNLFTANLSSSVVYTIANVYDQAFLGALVDSDDVCTNETSVLSPCLLRKYTRQENDFSRERLLFIGSITPNLRQLYHSFLNYSLTYNLTQFFDCDNVSTTFIEPSNAYQLFFVFKIGDHAEPRVRRRAGPAPRVLYFATEPSLPIETKSVDYYQLQQNNMGSNRDGLALWIVVVICVFSSLVLISIIIAIVAVIILRYKPSKFHKAAHVASQPSRINLRANNLSGRGGFKSSYEKDLEFGNSQNDFIEPGEFSKFEMTNIWLIKHANGDLILEEEYRNLPDFRNIKTSYVSQSAKNEVKNRFLDIKAYDDSRVVLEVANNAATIKKSPATGNELTAGNSQNSVDRSMISSMSTSTSSSASHVGLEPLGDYINANFVQGFSHDRKFIATQGPKRETIVDFWRMISQYRVTAIVMLTKLVEKGVERCTQYWPDKLNITESYGDFEVTLRDQQKCGDYIKRTFDLVNTNWTPATSSTAAMATTLSSRRILTVTQYYYPEWPDKDTPSTDPMSILHLIRDVNMNHPSYQYPIVVHCSAGVGRTGTYITLDAMMEKIDSQGKIDIYGFISKIRERRQYLVQTSKQYVFIHEALYEYCLYGFTAIEVGHIASHVRQIKEVATVNAQGVSYQPGTSAKTRLQIEFEKLVNAFSPNSQAREAFSVENKARNRNLNTICYDDNRIKLSTLNGSPYINATKIKGNDELNSELIITQDPMENTVFEFLKMITEFDCHIIVALNKEFELEKNSVYWPTASDPVRVFEMDDLKFVIEHVRPDDEDIEDTPGSHITKSFFEITEYKHSSSTKMDIVLFMYNEFWLENTIPKSRKNLLDLVVQVQKETANFDQTRIVVHGHGGGSNCSVFCALNFLHEQFKNDQYVDVCRTVKKLKTQRPHMIETYEQYEFLYNCLTNFVEMYGIAGRTSDSFYGRPASENEASLKKSPSKQPPDVLASNSIELNIR